MCPTVCGCWSSRCCRCGSGGSAIGVGNASVIGRRCRGSCLCLHGSLWHLPSSSGSAPGDLLPPPGQVAEGRCLGSAAPAVAQQAAAGRRARVGARGRRRQPRADEKGGSQRGPSPVDRGRAGAKHHLLVNISDATDNTYTLQRADGGRTLRALATAKNNDGSDSATSLPTLLIPATPVSTNGRRADKSAKTARSRISRRPRGCRSSPSTCCPIGQRGDGHLHARGQGREHLRRQHQRGERLRDRGAVQPVQHPREEPTGDDGTATLVFHRDANVPAIDQQQQLTLLSVPRSRARTPWPASRRGGSSGSTSRADPLSAHGRARDVSRRGRASRTRAGAQRRQRVNSTSTRHDVPERGVPPADETLAPPKV